MKNFENLNLIGEEQYKKTNKKIRTVSFCLIGIGIFLFIIGLIGFITNKMNYDKRYNEWYNSWWNQYGANLNDMPSRNYIGFVVLMYFSIAPIGLGIILLIITYRRQLVAYNVNTVAPIVGEVHEDYVKPFVEESGSTIGKAYNNFKHTANVKEKEVIKIRCPHCGKLNNEDAKYCDNCGEKL